MTVARDNRRVRCRFVRRQFSVLFDEAAREADTAGTAVLKSHLEACPGCGAEYRLYRLGRAALNAAGASETITPQNDFFVALRARIARGPGKQPAVNPIGFNGDESWAAALLLTARQLIPAMAMLLALIIGATLIWGNQPQNPGSQAMLPSERIVLGDVYEYRPTADDVLETLVAVEDRENGR